MEISKSRETSESQKLSSISSFILPAQLLYNGVIKFIYVCQTDCNQRHYVLPSAFPTGAVKKVMDGILSKGFDPETPFTTDLNLKVS